MREELRSRSTALLLTAGLSVMLGAVLLFFGFWAGFSGALGYQTFALLLGGAAFFLLGIIAETGSYNLKIRSERMK